MRLLRYPLRIGGFLHTLATLSFAAFPLVALLAASASPLAFTEETDKRELAALGPEATPLLALPLTDAPGATTVITAEEIERSAAANIFELLRRVPGVDIRYTPMGGHIGIRSTGASPFTEEVLMLIDGSPYNSPDKGGFPGHPNYTGFFPLDRIERIEIIKGPISVIYGANAFGGVINIVSKQAADTIADKIEGVSSGATLLVGSRDTFDRRVRAAAVKGQWDSTFELGTSDGATPIRLNGDADHSRTDAYVAARRGAFSFSALHQQNRNGSFDFEGTPTRTARQSVDILDTHYEKKAGEFVLHGSATLNRYRGTTCAVCHNNQTGPPDDAATSEVGNERETDSRVRVAFRADRTLTDHQDLNVGLEASHDSVHRDIVKIAGAPAGLDSGGVFVQHQWHFRDRSLHLLSGLRRDYAEFLGGATSPRFALVAEPTENLILRGSLARAFRAPTWNERYRRQRFLPEELAPGLILVFQGNPQLGRERIDTLEFGVSWRAAEPMVLKFDGYYNRIHDFIQLGPGVFTPGVPNEIRRGYENRDPGFSLRGGEITLLSRPLKNLDLTAAYAFRSSSLDHDDGAAAYAPRSRAILTAAWSPHPRWTFDLAGSYSSGYTVSSPDVFGVRPQPSYELFDAAARYHFAAGKGRFSGGLLVRNATNAHPRETLINDDIDTSLRGRVVALELKGDF
ncbi:MAG TPA: TonB-dependent receptor [Candidatus Polarisedimenticolia bacterium]|nr:TonB-dependent receptor [Candidatus Polarisedimenticolia bacterium]